jgi:hypothetical protein
MGESETVQTRKGVGTKSENRVGFSKAAVFEARASSHVQKVALDALL